MADHWKDNHIQFPRLISELNAIGVFNNTLVMVVLQASMDLPRKRILEIVQRAERQFQIAKDGLVSSAKHG